MSDPQPRTFSNKADARLFLAGLSWFKSNTDKTTQDGHKFNAGEMAFPAFRRALDKPGEYVVDPLDPVTRQNAVNAAKTMGWDILQVTEKNYDFWPTSSVEQEIRSIRQGFSAEDALPKRESFSGIPSGAAPIFTAMDAGKTHDGMVSFAPHLTQAIRIP